MKNNIVRIKVCIIVTFQLCLIKIISTDLFKLVNDKLLFMVRCAELQQSADVEVSGV